MARREKAVPYETAALVALLRSATRPPHHYASLVEEAGSALALLDEEQGLLAAEALAGAAADLKGWIELGIGVLTVLDPGYPDNLRTVHDRPPLIFVAGELRPNDTRAVAIIGSRRATAAGLDRARTITMALVDAGYTIVSGLASGIDTAAHNVALEHGRTVAVIGTGLGRYYPPGNETLQKEIAARGAVVSQFWPGDGPSRKTFPARNAVMSGLSLATVIVEAGPTSGARVQARHALGHGRPVLLNSSLLKQPWARDLSGRPGTYVVRSDREAVATVQRVSSTEVPVA